MKRPILYAAAVAGFVLAAGAAQAAPTAPSIALQDAARSLDLTQDVRYVCRRYWRHGHWHRRCWWEPRRHRHRHWRHRHWR
jgi:uncharacterized cupredoxin-like copper-binding protein